MLLCSENTASTADSIWNKMILYHLSENLCLQQRRKEERGCLQKEQGGGLGRYLDWSNKVGTALWYCTRHSTASSPGEMAHAYHGSSSPPSQVMLTEEQSGRMQQKGSSVPFLPTPGKQPAAVQAPGSSGGCQLLDPALCFWKRSCGRNDKTLLHLDEGKDFVAHGLALAD